jgi:F-type H+-transporting ATPase subunit epsilon
MAKLLTCIVVTPEQTSLEQTAEFVALPLYDGEIGIGSDHAPLIGRLGYGEMRLKTGNQTVSYYVDGGFVQVAGNVVSVLTNRAVAAEKVELKKAEELLDEATRKPANTDELLAIRERGIAQARAQIRVAKNSRR